jgi:Ni,Fe-hydrogenase maturation factor
VLALAELRGTLPRELVALGTQPERIELGLSLSPRVEAAVDAVVARAERRLAGWRASGA